MILHLIKEIVVLGLTLIIFTFVFLYTWILAGRAYRERACTKPGHWSCRLILAMVFYVPIWLFLQWWGHVFLTKFPALFGIIIAH